MGEAASGGVVVVVDDDADVRAAIDSLFRSVGLDTLLFGSARELMYVALPDRPCCLVVDVLLPGLSGLEFQAKLAARGNTVPIVFVTGYGDIPMAVQAMKAGAVDVLTKPLRDQDLLDAVAAALARDRGQRDRARGEAALRASYASLTRREREVMALVVRGLMNKQIAAELGLSEITVKAHRANMLRKMGTRTVPDLVRVAGALDPEEA